jgi:hypothetical protein
MASVFDGATMSQRLCPYAGQSTRTRVIHAKGSVMTGTLTNLNGDERAVTARFGPAQEGSSFYGWGITFENRCDPDLLPKDYQPVGSDIGDILLLGNEDTMYTNDLSMIPVTLKERGILAILSAAFKRTEKNPNFVRLPYVFFGVDKETRVQMKNDAPSFDLTQPSHWSFYNVHGPIGHLHLRPWDGITTGDELVFKHDLQDISKPFGIDTRFGLVLESFREFGRSLWDS